MVDKSKCSECGNKFDDLHDAVKNEDAGCLRCKERIEKLIQWQKDEKLNVTQQTGAENAE